MLDESGFTRPTYDQLVQDLTAKWLQLFGENANTATNSVGGILIRLMAFFLNQIYMLAEKVYQSQFVDSAAGPTLDQLAANVGITRLAAQAAIGTIKIYGIAGYVVPTGTLFQTADGLDYITSEDILLADTGQKSIDLSVEGLGTIAYDNQSVGLGVSTVLYANGEGSAYNKPDQVTQYPAEQVTPVESVLAVQVGLISGGADLESDDALRNRIELASDTTPSSPYNGVISALNNVPGVTVAKIVVNDTMATDANGNPPKTIHIYVDGGADDDIGTAIFDSIAAGIQTVGGTEVAVTDISGTAHKVYFDRPTSVEIYASIQVATNELYPLDGTSKIKQVVVDYVRSVPVGGTVYFSYLYRRLYEAVPGLVRADIKIGTSKDALSLGDVALTDVQRATITLDSVVVA